MRSPALRNCAEPLAGGEIKQEPWPTVDGQSFPAVLMNVDGSKFTEPCITAGAGKLVLDRHRGGR